MARPRLNRKPASARQPLVTQRQIADLTKLLGGHTLPPLILGTLVLVFLAWFADTTYGWLLDPDNASLSLPQKILGLGLFPALALILYLYARYWSRGYEVAVQVSEEPVAARGMISFLSPLRSDGEKTLERIIDENRGDAAGLWHGLNQAPFNVSWQMPLQALAYHADRLEAAVFLTSRDTEKGPGSARQFDLFRELVAAYPPTAHLTIHDYGELAGEDWGGIDPGDAKRIHHAFQTAHKLLCRQYGAKNYEVVTDLTGGMATATMAAVMFALGEGLVCQYVDTRDYKVRTYDLEYAPLET